MHTIFYIQPQLRKLQGRTCTVPEARMALRDAIYPLKLNIDVEFVRNKRKLKSISTSGQFTDRGNGPIVMYVYIPFHRRHITFTRKLIGEMVILLAHELRHRFQYKKGLKFKDNPLGRRGKGIGYLDDYPDKVVAKYLSFKEELDAYAYQYAVAKHFGYERAWIRRTYKQYVSGRNPAAYIQFCLKIMMPLLPQKVAVE